MNDIIRQAIYLIEDVGKAILNIQRYSPVYMFTTENLSGVMKSLDVCGKSVLTVSSSGDHIFDMLLNGATVVESYDINYFTRFYFYLKEAAIKALSYNEFLDFFFPSKFSFNSKVFDNEVFFRKILPNIKNEDAAIFWKTLFSRYKGKRLYNSKLFIQGYYSKSTYIDCINYLKNEDNYRRLQHKLAGYDYKFYWINIFNDDDKLPDKKYDIIYLSNVLDKLCCKDELSYLDKVRKIICRLKRHLTDKGILGICYLYYYLDDYWEILSPGQIASLNFRSKYFEGNDYVYKSFNGIGVHKSRRRTNRDALLMVSNEKY